MLLRCWHDVEFRIVVFKDPAARLQISLMLGQNELILTGAAAVVAPAVPSDTWPVMVFGFDDLPNAVRQTFWENGVQHFGIHGYGTSSAAPEAIYQLLTGS